MRTSLSRILSIVALYGAAGAVGVVGAGCGGGGGGGGKGRAAAAATAGHTVLTMPSARAEHSATLLPSGEVLVAGGVDISGDPVATTVIIGATSVRPGPDMASPRVGHSATLLASGHVLIAGGSSDAAGAAVLSTTEIYDPVTGTFSPGPDLAQPRTRHAALNYVTAAGELVLLAGGSSGLNQATPPAPVLLDSCEVMSVAGNASSPIAARLAAPQADARVARLDTGGILIVGGEAAQGPAPAQVFDPATLSLSAANAVVARSGAAVASRGREVLVAGGQSATGLEDSTEVFDSATRTFAQGVRLGAARRDAAIATVGADDIVIAGGRGAAGVVDTVEKLSGTNLGQAQVSTIRSLQSARESHTATGISNTKLVVVGGYDAQGVVLATVEVIDLAAPPPSSGAQPTGTTGPGALPGAPILPTPTTGVGTGTTPPITNPGTNPGSNPGAGSSSGSGGSFGSTLLNAALQAAVQALTSSGGSGSGFSGFLNAFLQNFLNNMLTGLLGGSGSSGSGGGLAGILSSLLGSGSGSSGGGLSGILSSLLGSLTGSSSGSGGGLSGLLSSLFGGSGSSSGSSGGGLSGLLSSLFGGSGSGSSGGLSGLFSSLFGGSGSTASGSTAAPTISGMTPTAGPIGTQVTIAGANFGTSVSVAFNGVLAPIQNTVTSGGQTVLFVQVPAGATSGPVTVTTNGQTVVAGTFTVQ